MNIQVMDTFTDGRNDMPNTKHSAFMSKVSGDRSTY